MNAIAHALITTFGIWVGFLEFILVLMIGMGVVAAIVVGIMLLAKVFDC